MNTYVAQILSCDELGLPRCDQTDGGNGIDQLLSIVFLAAGFVATLYLIIGAIRFASSGGDPNNVKQARDTILYALIGLVVSLLAFVIVTFIVGRT